MVVIEFTVQKINSNVDHLSFSFFNFSTNLIVTFHFIAGASPSPASEAVVVDLFVQMIIHKLSGWQLNLT